MSRDLTLRVSVKNIEAASLEMHRGPNSEICVLFVDLPGITDAYYLQGWMIQQLNLETILVLQRPQPRSLEFFNLRMI